MSYQVIARKFRPQTFEELVGQPHVSRALLNALKNDRLPHALLFSGARGVGKTSSARILAKSLRCPNVLDFVPCGTCRECEDIAAGSSIDVIEIDGASNNGVDSIRELRETVGYMPSSGKRKVYIIDEVHMLSTSAFNALLKTLEEPPPHVIFIFATTESQKIPITILSRCQRFDFRKISTREIAEKLKSICIAESVTYTDDALWVIARQAGGSMRDSQSLLDQAITFSEGQLTFDKVTEILGLTDRQLLTATLRALVGRDRVGAMSVVEQIFVSGYDPRVYAQDLLESLRNLLLVKLNPENLTAIVDLPDSEITSLRELSAHVTSEDIHLLFDMMLKGANDLARTPNSHVVLEMLLMRMVEAPRITEIESLLRGSSGSSGGNLKPDAKAMPESSPAPAAPQLSRPRVTAPHAGAPSPAAPVVQQVAKTPTIGSMTAAAAGPTGGIPNFALNIAPKTETAPAEQPRPAPPQPVAPAPAPAQQYPTPPYIKTKTPQENWASLIRYVKDTQPMLGAKLEHTALINIQAARLTLGVKPAHAFLLKHDDRTSDALKSVLAQAWGFKGEIIVEEMTTKEAPLSPKAHEEKKLAQEQVELHNEIENHPLVMQAKDMFKSRITQIREQT